MYLADYELGEEIILLDYAIGGAADFTTSYDFSTDYTAVTFKDGADTLEDRIFIKGNVKVANTESTTFTNAALTGSSDPSLNNATADTRLILERSTDVPAETIIGGAGDDYIIGEGGAEQIRTGGGNDTVFAGGGDDLVVVQGQGDSTVDTGAGDDKVVVSSDWSGTLLLKNGAGNNTLEVKPVVESMDCDEDGNLLITLADGSEITTEGHLELDSATNQYIVSDESFASVIFGSWAPGGTTYDFGFGALNNNLVRGSDHTDDRLYSASFDGPLDQDYHFIVSARDGDDEIYGGEGKQSLFGGSGDDTIYIKDVAQSTVVVGDRETGRSSNGEGQMPSITSENVGFSDTVYLEWQKSEVTLSNPREGYFRIEHAGTGSVVDIYDVENLYFSDGQGGYEYKPLTEGQVIGKAHWQGDAAGVDIEFEEHNVSFQVDGNMLKVLASATVTVTEEQFVENTVISFGTVIYNSMDFDYSVDQWIGWGGTKEYVEQVSVGVQTYDKVLQDAVIWEGNRTEVDAFEFADGVSVNVINVSTTDLADNPVFDTVGTDGIDLIFGNDGDNLIDGKGGDDIIFGGSGDDVIIGGEGDDVILGGDGADILRGDMVEAGDAAITAWQAPPLSSMQITRVRILYLMRISCLCSFQIL